MRKTKCMDGIHLSPCPGNIQPEPTGLSPFLTMRSQYNRLTTSPSTPRVSPLAISSSSRESFDEQVCYSANEDDLRRSSNRLAKLALRAESTSIRSLAQTDGSSLFDEQDEADGPDQEDEDQVDHIDDRRDSQEAQAQAQAVCGYDTFNGNQDVFSSPTNKSTRASAKTTLLGERSLLYPAHKYAKKIHVNPNNESLPTVDMDLFSKPPKHTLEFLRKLFTAFPAVLLGLMMNVLDGVSYGLIMFPTGAGMTTFDGFGGIGISMFFMTCIVSQLVYSLGGSAFHGGNGSMMIESVPFMHVIAKKIISGIGPEYPQRIIATTMVAFAMSSILTGIAFFALGTLKLGNLMGFFPRHILVGCIGSVGAFLLLTGVAVTGQLADGFNFSASVIHHLLQTNILPLWIVPLGLAIILRIVTCFFSQPFVVPAYFLSIPFIFYGITSVASVPLATLRSTGWVFDIGVSENSSPFAFYSLFDFHAVDWSILKTTVIAQLAMVIFGLLHVPLNVPALALSLNKDDVDINRELIAHGISNTLAGLTGTVSNYLCYVNSVLFARVGGDSRLAGSMLAVVMMGVFAVGPGVIAYLPVCVVGALIYMLGIDLLKEALWDTWGKVSWVEYGTIWAIIVAATWHDFVVGLVVGVILACMSFVATSSQHNPTRSVMDGCTARSTVRRHPTQHDFLKEVGKQTRVLKLQGHLFFGTISACERLIKSILQNTDNRPIQFLVVDFSSAASIDFSAVEAFVRIHRLLLSKSITFVLCGTGNQVTKALKSVGLWDGDGIEVFEYLNQALEHCENVYLKNLYFPGELDPRTALSRTQYGLNPAAVPGQDSPFFQNRPRSFKAPNSTRKKSSFSSDCPTPSSSMVQININPVQAPRSSPQPLALLLQTFRPFLPEQGENFWIKIAPYFARVEFKQDTCIWQMGTKADWSVTQLDAKHHLEASYAWPTLSPMRSSNCNTSQTPERKNRIEESMLPGTVAGDHTFLAQLHRNTRVAAETDAVLWRMERASWNNLDLNLKEIIGIGLLKMAAVEEEVLIGHLFTRF